MTRFLLSAAALSVAMFSSLAGPAFAEDTITADANAALQQLYASEPVAKMIGEKAKAVLVFPNIVKAGFIVGGQYGEGVLFKNGKFVAHYNSVAGSYGLQAGGQKLGYALFLMNDQAIENLDK